MKHHFRLTNGLPATLHWLSDAEMQEVAEVSLKQLISGANAYAVIEINFEKETVYLVGNCCSQTHQYAADVAKYWSVDPEAIDRTRLLVCNGTCYRLDRSKKGQIILAGVKKGLPPSICVLIEEGPQC